MIETLKGIETIDGREVGKAVMIDPERKVLAFYFGNFGKTGEGCRLETVIETCIHMMMGVDERLPHILNVKTLTNLNHALKNLRDLEKIYVRQGVK